MATGLTIEDYFKLKFLKSVDIDHQGTQVVYPVERYVENESDDGFHHLRHINLWILDRLSGDNRQLTFGDHDLNPSWSPDSKFLVYSSERDDTSQLYCLSMSGGEPRQLTEFENGVQSKAIWDKHGDVIYFTAIDDTTLPDKESPYWYDRDFYRMDTMGNVDRVLQNIYRYNLETNQLEQITDDRLNHVRIHLSPDESKILTLFMFEKDDVNGIYPRLGILTLSDGNLERIVDHYIVAASWIDETRIAFIGKDPTTKIGTKSDVFVYHLEGNQLDNLTADDPYGYNGTLQADMPTKEARLPRLVVDGSEILYNAQIGGNIEIRAVNMDNGKISTVVGGNQSNFVIDICDRDVFYLSSDLHNPLDLHVFNRTTTTNKQLTRLNKDVLQSTTLPETRHLIFRGTDGTEVEGWLLLPQTGEPPYPTLLNIHGGPHMGWGNIFQFEPQYLCSAGYAVLMINHRGSTGYGDDFASSIVGDWGNLDYKDLMSGVDYVIDLELADHNRLGCFGISGGGNLSSWIVGQTDRFKAAIPENPVTNWRSFYGVSDIGRWFAVEEMGGLPWEIPEVYIQSSPLSHAHNCTTPTLLIQHDDDLRCPPEQSEQFYAVLREVNCPVKMLRMPGTPHGGSVIGSLEIRETQNREILAWFDKYV